MNTLPKKSWLRFSLRTMLVVVTVLCVLLAWKVRQAERQKAVVEWVEENGGGVTYQFEFVQDRTGTTKIEPSGPNWLRQLAGDDFARPVVWVIFRDTEVVDLSPLWDIAPLEKLLLLRTTIPDSEVARFKKDFPDCKVTISQIEGEF